MMAEDGGGPGRMRISDVDRDKVASVLSDALAQGRLTATEHSERLDAVYAAKTAADLEPLVADLPGAEAALPGPASHGPYPARRSDGAGRKRSWMVSVFSGNHKSGAWQVPAEIGSVNVFGGSELDLREAVLPSGEVSISVLCVFGGAQITVPPQMRVIDSGFSIFGGRSVPSGGEPAARPDGPVLRVHAICVFGGIEIIRRRRLAGARSEVSGNELRAVRREVRDQIRQARSDVRRARRSGRRR